jgi:hypothetical protein
MSDRHPSPPLLEEEWVLLLDTYLSHQGKSLSPTHPAIVSASRTLVALAHKAGRKVPPNFRLPEGIRRQMGAFRHLDPAKKTSDKKVAEVASSVWKRLSSDPEACRRAADAVRLKVGEGQCG